MEYMSLAVSIVMAIISVCAALFAFWQAQIASRMFKKTFRPFVIAYIEPSKANSKACHLVVKNIGTEPATKITMWTRGKIPMHPNAKEEVTDFLDNVIPFLEPGGERRTFLGFFPDLVNQQSKDKDAFVCIKAREMKQCEDYPINVHTFTAAIYDKSNLEIAIEKLTKTIRGLTKEKPLS